MHDIIHYGLQSDKCDQICIILCGLLTMSGVSFRIQNGMLIKLSQSSTLFRNIECNEICAA